MSENRGGSWVILRHLVAESPASRSERGDHWDLMLQVNQVLWTWAIETPLPTRGVKARRLADHRLHYLTYEGPLDGNRGTVTRVASGSFRWLAEPQQKLDRFEIDLGWPDPNCRVSFRLDNDPYWWIGWSDDSS